MSPTIEYIFLTLVATLITKMYWTYNPLRSYCEVYVNVRYRQSPIYGQSYRPCQNLLIMYTVPSETPNLLNHTGTENVLISRFY